MRAGSVIAGIVTLAAIGMATGMISSSPMQTKRMRRKAMRAINEVADSLSDIIHEIL